MKLDIDKANEILLRWQKILKLQDYDIHLEVAGESWRKSGDMKVDLCNKQAVIILNSNPKVENLNELIIHELLHIKLWGMDQMIEDLLSLVYGEDESDKKKYFAETQFMTLLEKTVQDLTKGYIDVSELGPLSANSLKKMVKEELSC